MTNKIHMGLALLGLAAAQPALAQNGAQNGAHGKALFAQCRACHTDVKGARSTVGPNLSGVVGRKAGSLAGFAYSPAMKAAGIVWTPARIAAYLAAPARAVPGNRMGYAGMASPGDRADLVAYLESLR